MAVGDVVNQGIEKKQPGKEPGGAVAAAEGQPQSPESQQGDGEVQGVAGADAKTPANASLFRDGEPKEADPFQSQFGETSWMLRDPLLGDFLLSCYVSQLALPGEARHLVFVPHGMVPKHAQALGTFVVAHVELLPEIAARKDEPA